MLTSNLSRRLARLSAVPARHGSSIPSHDGTRHMPGRNIEYATHTAEYLKDQAPTKTLLSEKLELKLMGYWNPLRDDELTNDHVQKASMYHWFPNTPLGAKPIVSLLAKIFSRTQVSNMYEQDKTLTETSQWLYRTDQEKWAKRSRYVDWFMVGSLPLCWISPVYFINYFFYGVWAFTQWNFTNYMTHRADLDVENK